MNSEQFAVSDLIQYALSPERIRTEDPALAKRIEEYLSVKENREKFFLEYTELDKKRMEKSANESWISFRRKHFPEIVGGEKTSRKKLLAFVALLPALLFASIFTYRYIRTPGGAPVTPLYVLMARGDVDIQNRLPSQKRALIRSGKLVATGSSLDAAESYIKPNTVLETAGNSSLALQMGPDVIIRLRPHTRLIFREIQGRKARLELKEGTLLAQVRPGVGADFIVKTGTGLVQVVGTRFAVTYESGRKQTGVAVQKGRVRAELRSKSGVSHKLKIAGGEALDFKPSSSKLPRKRALKGAEKLIFRKVGLFEFVEKKDLRLRRESWREKEKVLDKKIKSGQGKEKKEKSTIPIQRIILYGGEVLIGRVLSRGEEVLIQKKGGEKIRVKAAKIRGFEPFKK